MSDSTERVEELSRVRVDEERASFDYQNPLASTNKIN